MIDQIIHMSVYILMPPLLFGIMNKTKAYLAGRRGAPLLQPYYDLIRLFKKKMVISSTTTWVFYAGPIVTMLAVIVAGLLMPLGQSHAIISFTGDFILFAYLFALARFFTTIAAMDTGSAFEGMGVAREMTFSAIIEPGLFFAFLVFVKLSGSMSLTVMLQRNLYGSINQNNFAPLVMVIIGLSIILLAENSRIPVDDPNTHLELTMIHEAMVLDHSGPLLGLIEYAANVKFFILSSLLCTVMVPIFSSDGWLSWLGFLTGIILISFMVGIVESIMARLRMSRVTILLFSAFLLCGSAVIIFER